MIGNYLNLIQAIYKSCFDVGLSAFEYKYDIDITFLKHQGVPLKHNYIVNPNDSCIYYDPTLIARKDYHSGMYINKSYAVDFNWMNFYNEAQYLFSIERTTAECPHFEYEGLFTVYADVVPFMTFPKPDNRVTINTIGSPIDVLNFIEKELPVF